MERVFGRLKDEFGGRHVRVRGQGKVACHLMFGMLALTVDQLLRSASRPSGPGGCKCACGCSWPAAGRENANILHHL